MRSVAVVIQPGFAPFEFGLACEAFGLDRSDDGIPNFDFRIVAPDPGVVPSNIGFSVNVERGLEAAADVDILVLAPIPGRRGEPSTRVCSTSCARRTPGVPGC